MHIKYAVSFRKRTLVCRWSIHQAFRSQRACKSNSNVHSTTCRESAQVTMRPSRRGFWRDACVVCKHSHPCKGGCFQSAADSYNLPKDVPPLLGNQITTQRCLLRNVDKARRAFPCNVQNALIWFGTKRHRNRTDSGSSTSNVPLIALLAFPVFVGVRCTCMHLLCRIWSIDFFVINQSSSDLVLLYLFFVHHWRGIVITKRKKSTKVCFANKSSKTQDSTRTLFISKTTHLHVSVRWMGWSARAWIHTHPPLKKRRIHPHTFPWSSILVSATKTTLLCRTCWVYWRIVSSPCRCTTLRNLTTMDIACSLLASKAQCPTKHWVRYISWVPDWSRTYASAPLSGAIRSLNRVRKYYWRWCLVTTRHHSWFCGRS